MSNNYQKNYTYPSPLYHQRVSAYEHEQRPLALKGRTMLQSPPPYASHNMAHPITPQSSQLDYYQKILNPKTLFNPEKTSLSQLKYINSTALRDLEKSLADKLAQTIQSASKQDNAHNFSGKNNPDLGDVMIDNFYKKITAQQEAALSKAMGG